jgi:hypothetical protein
MENLFTLSVNESAYICSYMYRIEINKRLGGGIKCIK